MIKEHYKKEFCLTGVKKKGDKGEDVKKIQEWLNLWRYIDPQWTYKVTVDEDFGTQTEIAVISFQEHFSFINTPKGEVDDETFHQLCLPLRNAFKEVNLDNKLALSAYVRWFAHQHLDNTPRELNNQNEGAWVRSYMDGNEGAPWAWCMGFVQTILDQSFSQLNRRFTELMPHSYSCDVVGQHGINTLNLIRNKDVKKNPGLVKLGDIFLNVRTPHDWVHTGLIVAIDGEWFTTVEGNTNDEGSREGFEVCKRMRNFVRNNIDVFSLGE